MSTLQLDEILVGNDQDMTNRFEHRDVNGLLLESITVSKTLYNPGYTPANVWVMDFAQYAGGIYVLITDTGQYNAVAEYDSDLNFVRFVCRVLNSSDPAQNPDHIFAGFFELVWGTLSIDAHGVIYIASGWDRERIFRYNNDGSFKDFIDIAGGVITGNPSWTIKLSTGEINAPYVGASPNQVVVQRFNTAGVDQGAFVYYTRPSGIANFDYKGGYDRDENFYVGSNDFTGGLALNPQIHIVDPTWSTVTHIPITVPSGMMGAPSSIRPTSDATKAWAWVARNDNKDYICQFRLSDGALLLVPRVVVTTTHSGHHGLFVYTGVPNYPPCVGADFTAQCGDVFIALGNQDAPCERVEAWRNGVRVGRLIVINSNVVTLGMTMCFDPSGNLYVPQLANTDDGIVKRLSPTGKHYTSNPTNWFTASTNEHPIHISADRTGNIYVLVLGGHPIYGGATYLRLYKLDASASVLHTYNLTTPAGHIPAGVFGGAYVDPNGSRYLYAFQDGPDAVIAAWDLVNDVALPTFATDTGYATLFPIGLRFRQNGQVLIGNMDTSTSFMRAYASDGSTFTDYTSTFGFLSGFGDISLSGDNDHAYLVDGNGVLVYRVQFSTGIVTRIFTAAPGFYFVSPMAVLCAVKQSRIFGFITTPH